MFEVGFAVSGQTTPSGQDFDGHEWRTYISAEKENVSQDGIFGDGTKFGEFGSPYMVEVMNLNNLDL